MTRPRHLRYERHHEPLLPRPAFIARMLRHGVLSGGIVGVSLVIGAVGYRVTADLPWIDAFENASMILTGMGPVSPMPSNAAKLFATAYALFSGVVFITSIGVILAPALHRMLHHFHLQEGSEEADDDR